MVLSRQLSANEQIVMLGAMYFASNWISTTSQNYVLQQDCGENMARGTAVDIREWRIPIHQDLIPAGRQDAAMAKMLSAFGERLPISPQVEPTLGGALRSLLAHAGSMVRPRIVYRLASAYGIEEEAATDLAIALEYFHTASLVFDDLPCMDNASMRRGAPCVHVAFGESAAILAALALINRAYALSWRAIASCDQAFREPARIYLEQRLGIQGLLNGQSLDLNYSNLPHTPDSAERVAQGKTVSLISLTLVLPALAGGATRRELQLLHRISTCWGLSYQIVDDLKDILESSSTSGKTAARDLHLGRPNMALAIGVGGAVNRLLRLLHAGDRNLEMLIRIRPTLSFLREFRGTLTDELNRVIEGAEAIPINKKR
jgi:geranylgeranyl diphosphate synthase, type II